MTSHALREKGSVSELVRRAAVAAAVAAPPVRTFMLSAYTANPGCSWNAVRKGVTGRDESKQDALQRLLASGRLVDHGDSRRGRRLEVAGTPHGTGPEQPRNNPRDQDGGQGVVPRGSPLRGESPPSGTTSTPASGAALDEVDVPELPL